MRIQLVRFLMMEIIMRIKLIRVVTIYFLFLPMPSFALTIVTCEPEWAQLVREIGGGKISVRTVGSRVLDFHHISLSPYSIALVRSAHLIICNNIRNNQRLTELIIKSDNPRIRAGQPGRMEADQYAKGQAPQENAPPDAPHHIQGDPRNILAVAGALTERLSALDASNSRYYRENYLSFSKLWNAEIQNWERLASPLKGMAIVVQRNSCEYLCRWLGVREIAKLESTQTGAIGTRQMLKVLKTVNSEQVGMIVTGPYHPSAATRWLARESNLPIVILPIADDAMLTTTGLEGFFDVSINRMLNVISHQKNTRRSSQDDLYPED